MLSKAYAAALLTLCFGALLSLAAHDWSWFGRSGSLVVIIGIVLTSHQILDHIDRLKQNQIRVASQFGRDWAGNDKEALIHDPREGIWQNEKYGLYMLICGTLVWGFGDLINYL